MAASVESSTGKTAERRLMCNFLLGGVMLRECPEINPSNYDHDDVCDLNDWAVEAANEIEELRELIKAKNQYIGCYKTGRRPTEKLFATLERLTERLFPST